MEILTPLGFSKTLPAGIYDAIGQLTKTTVTIQLHLKSPKRPELIFSITDLTNDTGNGNGSVTFGGRRGYIHLTYFLWTDSIIRKERPSPLLSAGNYIGYIQDANGCIIESPFEIILETSISNPDLGILELNVFPNPFSRKNYFTYGSSFRSNDPLWK